MEKWKEINGYEGLYMISNYGNVKSLNYKNHGTEKILTPKKNNKGYFGVELFSNGIGKYFLVHRLVASAFVDNKENLPVVNHIDENKLNNNSENLEWCTYSYNTSYSLNKRKEIRGLKRKSKYNSKVLMKDFDGNVLSVFENISDVKDKLNFNYWSIRQCCMKNRKQAYGYKWEFVE